MEMVLGAGGMPAEAERHSSMDLDDEEERSACLAAQSKALWLDYLEPGSSLDIFDRLGSWEGLSASVDAMHERVTADPRTAPFFKNVDHDKLVGHITAFIGSALSGRLQHSPRTIWELHRHLLANGPPRRRHSNHGAGSGQAAAAAGASAAAAGSKLQPSMAAVAEGVVAAEGGLLEVEEGPGSGQFYLSAPLPVYPLAPECAPFAVPGSAKPLVHTAGYECCMGHACAGMAGGSGLCMHGIHGLSLDGEEDNSSTSNLLMCTEAEGSGSHLAFRPSGGSDTRSQPADEAPFSVMLHEEAETVRDLDGSPQPTAVDAPTMAAAGAPAPPHGCPVLASLAGIGTSGAAVGGSGGAAGVAGTSAAAAAAAAAAAGIDGGGVKAVLGPEHVEVMVEILEASLNSIGAKPALIQDAVKVVRDLRYIFTRGDLFVDPTGSEIRWHKQHRATARSQAAAAAGTRGFLFAQSPDLFGSQGRGGRLGAGAHHSHRHHHQHHHHGGVGMSSSIPGASGGSGNSGSSGSGNSGGSPTRWLPGVYAAPASALRSCVTGACMSNSSTEAVAGEVDDGGLNLASLEECQEWSTACDGYLAGAQAQALRERGAGSHLFGSTYPGPLLPCAEEGHEA